MKISNTLLLVFKLCLFMSCEKQEKICTETCCSFDSARYKFIADLKDAEANLGNNGFWLKTPLNGAHGVIICDLSLDMVKGLPFTYDPKNIADSTFAYRISGKLYDNLDDFPLTSYPPVYDIKLSKVDKTR